MIGLMGTIRHRTPLHIWITYLLCSTVIGLTLCLIVPFSAALTAGLAAVSVVIYSLAGITIALVWLRKPPVPRLLLLTAAASVAIGLIVPQAALLMAAERHQTALTFDPLSYLRFSGETTLQPDQTPIYKTVNGHPLRLAVYKPHTKNNERSTVIMLHGGGWRYGNYQQLGLWPSLLTQSNHTVVSIQYQLSSDTTHTWREAPQDVHDALRYIIDNASMLGIDRDNLYLFGQSAGGHLALLEAYRHRAIRGVIALYAPVDPDLDYRTSRDKSAELDFIGGPPGQYPDRYRTLSPLTYLDGNAPTTLIVQGRTDDLVSERNATTLATALTKNQVEHRLVILPLTGHSFDNQHGGFATQITTQQVLDFIRQ